MKKDKETEYKVIGSKVQDECFYSVLDGKTPQEVKEHMDYLIERFSGRNVYFVVDYYGYDGGKELELWESRLETEKEYKKRMAALAIRRAREDSEKEKKEEKERTEYERLKKKFEKKGTS